MASDKPALVLLHGMTSSDRAWEDVLPALSRYHEVYTPNALGHRGGERVRHPTSMTDVIDAAERYLDRCGLESPHVAGHSMGGHVAIELARRGRAATVTALSPSGFWSAADAAADRITHGLQSSVRLARRAGPVMKVVVSSATGRRLLMGSAMCHPERMTAAQARAEIEDHAACTLGDGPFIADDGQIAPLDPLPCPITVAWAEKDGVLPLARYENAVRRRLPGASFIVLPAVGHAAMVDDPDLVDRTILNVTGTGRRQR